MKNLKEIEKVAEKFENDVNLIKKELKRIQSAKCRLLKQKGKSNYEKLLTELLQTEQMLKEARSLLEMKPKTVPEYTQADVDLLDYNETLNALNSIRSKKTNSKWLTTEPGENAEYKNACKVEEMLLKHKAQLQPETKQAVTKKDLQTVIDTIASNKDLTNERIIELLQQLQQ